MEPQDNESQSIIEPLKKVTPLSKYLAMTLFIIMPFLGGWIGYRYAPEKVVGVEKEVVKKVAEVQYINSLISSRPGLASSLSFMSIAQSQDGRVKYYTNNPHEGFGYSPLYYTISGTSSNDFGLYTASPYKERWLKINQQQFDKYRNTPGAVNWLVLEDHNKLAFISPSEDAPERCDAPELGNGLEIGNNIYIIDMDTVTVYTPAADFIKNNVSYQILGSNDGRKLKVLKQTHVLVDPSRSDISGQCAGKVSSEEEVTLDIADQFTEIKR